MESTENKVMAALAYVSVLVLIPIFVGEKKGFVRRHVNQGFNIWLISIACGIIASITAFIPLLGLLISIVIRLIGVVLGVLSIIGIVFAAQGKYMEFPIVGSIKLLSE